MVNQGKLIIGIGNGKNLELIGWKEVNWKEWEPKKIIKGNPLIPSWVQRKPFKPPKPWFPEGKEEFLLYQII